MNRPLKLSDKLILKISKKHGNPIDYMLFNNEEQLLNAVDKIPTLPSGSNNFEFSALGGNGYLETKSHFYIILNKLADFYWSDYK